MPKSASFWFSRCIQKYWEKDLTRILQVTELFISEYKGIVIIAFVQFQGISEECGPWNFLLVQAIPHKMSSEVSPAWGIPSLCDSLPWALVMLELSDALGRAGWLWVVTGKCPGVGGSESRTTSPMWVLWDNPKSAPREGDGAGFVSWDWPCEEQGSLLKIF